MRSYVHLFVSYLYSFPFSQELILRDNKLMKIPDVSIFKSLLVFDVSFNEISSLNGLSKVSSTLKELYVSKNEVAKMEELDHLHELQILELGSNRLRVNNLKYPIMLLFQLETGSCFAIPWWISFFFIYLEQYSL